MKTKKLEFQIYPENPNLRAIMFYQDNIDGPGKVISSVKLLFDCPKGQYYSFLADAVNTAKELINKTKSFIN